MDALSAVNRLHPEIRHMQMLKIITSHDFTHVRVLSALFRVSQVTIRADLNLLAAQPRKQMGSPCSVQQVAAMYDQAAADLVHSGKPFSWMQEPRRLA
jgi:DeoR-like helix-turn-helix domain